jgi:hypothetical protein
MAKAKKKKTKGKQKDSAASATAASLKAITQHPLVADIVAAALVSTAAAIKDSRKARQLAEQAGDELTELAKDGAEKGSAMWQLALEVGRRALDSLGETPAKTKNSKAPKSAKSSKPSKATKKPKRETAARKAN